MEDKVLAVCYNDRIIGVKKVPGSVSTVALWAFWQVVFYLAVSFPKPTSSDWVWAEYLPFSSKDILGFSF